ncbi:hypothetical protein QBC42DRAFT_250727 [Cladorrhinum samala]|uniref:Uncharacterized protein n=1 Tax=Cladorrhinum samala TaxID=585594 RepID=A0AAV9HT12_9PEZI|nr:hypothetical protein QBC42DRAFT_250727 [Cladorrhinum samala]
MASSRVRPKKLSYDAYTVGWVAVLPCEIDAARLLLENVHQRLPKANNDNNTYILGDVEGHNVVLAFPGLGQMGISAATHVATNMVRTFKKIRFALLVGVAGGAPGAPDQEDPLKDIRLGDVVVSCPLGGQACVIQADFGKQVEPFEFIIKSYMNNPPSLLLSAVNALSSDHRFGEGEMMTFIQDSDETARAKGIKGHSFPGWENDQLFKASYSHFSPKDADCSACDAKKVEIRLTRDSDRPAVHYGPIASGNSVVRSSKYRDRMRAQHGILCFEMEAAGLMNNFPCLVIRGICDYSDDHKNKLWQPYAATTAAAYARDLLRVIEPEEVSGQELASDVLKTEVQGIHQEFREFNRNYKEVEAEKKVREAQRQQEKEDEKYLATLEALRTDISPKNDMSHALMKQKQPHPGTCRWFFGQREFRKWVAQETEHPILWLYGAPGAGKTVLCTAAIQWVKEHKGKHTTVFSYITDNTEFSRFQFLWNLASQLLDNLKGSLSQLSGPPNLEAFLRLRWEDSASLERLISLLLDVLPSTYIFIDGLDEAEGYVLRHYPVAPSVSTLVVASNDGSISLPPATNCPDCGTTNCTTGSCHSRLKKLDNDMNRTLAFLYAEMAQRRDKVRLWCSSQYTGSTRTWMHSCSGPRQHTPTHPLDLVQEFPLTVHNTKEDMLDYLTSAIPSGASEEEKDAVNKLLTPQIETNLKGSFLWASLLRDDMTRVEDASDLLEILENEQLPKQVDDYFEKHIQRIKVEELHGTGGRKKPPTWKIVLSLVVYAKRPLLRSEIIDAVAIMRTRESENLNTRVKVWYETILRACKSLIKVLAVGKTGQADPIITVNDGAVRSFLLSRSASAGKEGDDQLVDHTIIRDCCYRYLMQPKYAAMLRKISPSQFETVEPAENISTHRLLLYAAKYWHQHFDSANGKLDVSLSSSSSGQQMLDQVLRFLQSSNFVTCVQVQSLFVDGHFAQRFDAITDRAVSARRVFPNWLCGGHSFNQYYEFMSEWSELLQGGLTSNFNGELERCFWPTLGSESFLSRNRGRYECQVLEAKQPCELTTSTSDGISQPCEPRCWVQKISQDRLQVTSCLVSTEPSTSTPTLFLEHWTLGEKHSDKAETQTLKYDGRPIDINKYHTPCSKPIPLIPSISCLVPPDGVQIFPGSAIARIGPKFFTGVGPAQPEANSNKPATTSITHLDSQIGEYWEDICSRNDILVTCRRRVPRSSGRGAGERFFSSDESSSNELSSLDESASSDESSSLDIAHIKRSRIRRAQIDDKLERLKAMRKLLARTSARRAGLRTEDLELAHESLSDSDSNSSVSSKATSGSFGLLSDPGGGAVSESNSMDIDPNTPTYSPAQQDSSDEAEGGFGKPASIASGGFSAGYASSNDGSVRSFSSRSRSESDGESIAGFSAQSETSHNDEAVAEALGNPTNLGESQYNVAIRGPDPDPYCTVCEDDLPRRRYTCNLCKVSICRRCVGQARKWCANSQHQLFDMIHDKAVGAILRPEFAVEQEIRIFRSRNNGAKVERVLFKFQDRLNVMLHDSPPVIHPQHPLVVWPLSGTKLLFANFERDSYFIQNIGSTERGARPICVNLSFSPCGTMLRVAKVEATLASAPTTPSAFEDYFESMFPDELKEALLEAGAEPESDVDSDGDRVLKVKIDPDKITMPGGGVKTKRRCLHLKLRVMILKLSPKKPARSEPSLAGSVTLDVRCGVRPLVHQLPFSFTWDDRRDRLYCTVSGSRLRVYRVDLAGIVRRFAENQPGKDCVHTTTNNNNKRPNRTTAAAAAGGKRTHDGIEKNNKKKKKNDNIKREEEEEEEEEEKEQEKKEQGKKEEAVVLTPKETVFLPRSARMRSVQFLPASLLGPDGNKAAVVVGPRYGKQPRPGFCLYLDEEKDLGEWVSPEDKEDDESEASFGGRRTLGSLYERFDMDEDCDIIPL